MSRTGLEDAYIMRGSKKLRMGYTTGSCAAAAARGAAFMLLSGKEIQEVKIHTPKGIVLNLELLDIRRSAEKVSCAVRKDGGDDPDVTDKALIYAEVTFGTEEGIVIDGGFGVGRVTKPGLDQPVGNAAINHVPRQMIRENVEEIQKKLDDFRALQVVISVPEGEELAKHTFNPRLGITGGISILGTSGIVVPMSEEALISTIRVEMEMRKAQGDRVLLVTPGNYGQDFLKTYPWVRADHSVKCSNYVGKTLEFAAELGFDAILFVAHLGKFVKVSGGIMNTHSHEADCRAELLTAQAVRAGADLALAKKLLSSPMLTSSSSTAGHSTVLTTSQASPSRKSSAATSQATLLLRKATPSSASPAAAAAPTRHAAVTAMASSRAQMQQLLRWASMSKSTTLGSTAHPSPLLRNSRQWLPAGMRPALRSSSPAAVPCSSPLQQPLPLTTQLLSALTLTSPSSLTLLSPPL